MRRLLFLLIFILNQKLAFALPVSKQVTGVISQIPFVIKSDDYLVSFNYKDTFIIQTGRLQLFIFDKNIGVEFDQVLHVNEPTEIKPNLETGVLNIQKQIYYPNNKTQKDKLLLDTSLVYGNILTIVWVDKRSNIVQKFVFVCSKMVPKLLGFRSVKGIDGTSQAYKARRLNKNQAFPIEFTRLRGKIIETETNGYLELIIQKPNLILDSIVEYRIVDKNGVGKIKWSKAGHLITLNEIKSNSNFFIELKYRNQPESILVEIITLKKFYQKLWFIAIALIFILSIVFFSTRWHYKRKLSNLTIQRNRVEDKLKMLQSQLNPHFVFNALSSIEGLVTAGENELANQYLANFSLILRETLRNMDKILLSLEEEINLIDKYCKVEQLRFGFQYKIVIDDNINKTAIELPPLLLQPIVENAIKHGLAGLGKNGYLEIAINKKENNLDILVKNNRTNAYTNIPTAGGFGLKYLNQRIVHFNQLNSDTPISYEFQLFDKEAISKINFQNCFL